MFILEGNIGAGKTTLLNQIRAYQDEEVLPYVEVVFEPVNSWHRQENGQSLLGNFYADIPRWAYTLETYAMACRVREHMYEQQKTNPYKLIERSIYSGHYCFAQNSYRSGGMTKLEWHVYNSWFSFLLRNKCKAPLGFVYLKSDPQVCFERVQKRGRAGESGITLDYLKHIDAAHNEFLLNKNGVTEDLKHVPVLILDGNQPFEGDHHVLKQYYNCISTFMINICQQVHAKPNGQQVNL